MLRPEAQVTHTERHLPLACDRCGTALPTAAGPDDPPDQRHQVVDVLPVQLQVTEHQLAARTRKLWLPDASGLAGRGARGGRGTPAGDDACRAHRPLPAVQAGSGAVEQQVSAALAPVGAEVRAAVPVVTVFHIDPSRGGQVARALLDADWTGVVGSDRFAAYRWLALGQRQVCRAHLRRDFPKLVDWGAGPRPVGERLLNQGQGGICIPGCVATADFTLALV